MSTPTPSREALQQRPSQDDLNSAERMLSGAETSLRPQMGPQSPGSSLSEATTLLATPNSKNPSSTSSRSEGRRSVSPSSHPPPIPTDQVLQNFKSTRERLKYVQGRKSETQHQQRIRDQRQKWIQNRSDIESLEETISGRSTKARLPREWNANHLLDLVKEFYPTRARLEILVYDLGPDRTNIQYIALGDIVTFFEGKPDWADVRWIHAPVGSGPVHSTLEDLFLASKREKTPKFSDNSSWPYPGFDVLNFRSREELRTLKEAYQVLRAIELQHPDYETKLKDYALEGLSDEIIEDVNWRVDHLGIEPSHWNLVGSDVPFLLGEGTGYTHDPRDQKKYGGPSLVPAEPQSLAVSHECPRFRDAHLVRTPFRGFHRPDGYLLTMSAHGGINYLNKRFDDDISQIRRRVFDDEGSQKRRGSTSKSADERRALNDEDLYALDFIVELFSKTGTSTWHRKTPEWLMIYIFTELGCTPHNIRQGRNCESLSAVYSTVVDQLKGLRFKSTSRQSDRIKQVHDFNACIDELTSIRTTYQKALRGFKQIHRHVELQEKTIQERIHEEKLEDESAVEKDSIHAIDRLEWAISEVQASYDICEDLLNDVVQSLEFLCQVRAIEENELVKRADVQNRVVLVFTFIAGIFLPLSFLTGYFGMNLQDIRDMNGDQRLFWKIVGGILGGVIVCVLCYAYKNSVQDVVRNVLKKDYSPFYGRDRKRKSKDKV